MPEGPSIVLLREAAGRFTGCSVHSWGKHFLLQWDDFSLRIHLMMFGSWLVGQRKPAAPGQRCASTTTSSTSMRAR